METNLFDTENTQELGNYKSVPFLSKEEEAKAGSSKDIHPEENEASHLGFICCLSGNTKESVRDVQSMIFNDNTYVFVQFTTCIEVWRHQAHEDWMKIFIHQVDDALQLKKLCLLKNEDYLSLVLLLTSQHDHCLQFVLFERNSKIIKVLENSHWLNEGQSADTVLLCDLNGLMFATAQGDDTFKVHSHTFADMNDNPRLISVELGSTTNHLCSICKIEKLPNALMGISSGTLYVWHLLEARLVTAVTLQPQDYLPIIDCIWATVEKGLVFFITTTKDENNLILSQLLAANLATGFCQTVIPFNVRPAKLNDQESNKTVKAKYCEPYLLVSYKSQAFFWSVMDEYCCAVLDENHKITAVTVGQDIEGYQLVAVGNKTGCVNFYKLN
ncbi:uncharacterized protein LOC129228186 [Uloborus diversus]|uniref:uncharacterized protein LOC129228186 n=1 Tax=Uloborus diversus TaxID=327109 RepID=UPI00240A11E7|nr:uncharacterized protein LOC129228186 [Uloborus diversus]